VRASANPQAAAIAPAIIMTDNPKRIVIAPKLFVARHNVARRNIAIGMLTVHPTVRLRRFVARFAPLPVSAH
jgi:hypothetical protein